MWVVAVGLLVWFVFGRGQEGRPMAGAYRCPSCLVNYPANAEFAKCGCGATTDWMGSTEPDLTLAEARSRHRHIEFECRYRDHCEALGYAADGLIPDEFEAVVVPDALPVDLVQVESD